MQDYPLRIYSQLKTRYSVHHWINFTITFFSVASITAVWKTLANVKPTLVIEWTPEPEDHLTPSELWYSHNYLGKSSLADLYLGGLDSCFLLFNSIGFFIMGPVGDRLKSQRKLLLVIFMVTSVTATYLFGCLPDHASFFNVFYFLVFWSINGFAQAPVIPLSLAIMGNWFGKSRRGIIFGLWSSSVSVGSIMSNLMCIWALKYGYSYCFVVNLFTLTSATLFTLSGLTQLPGELGVDAPLEFDINDLEDREVESSKSDVVNDDRSQMLSNLALLNGGASSPSNGSSLAASGEFYLSDFFSSPQIWKTRAIRMKEAWAHPDVALYALSYAAVKVVIYSLLLWLPYYISETYDTDNIVAVRYAAFFDFGAIIGGTLLGLLMDWAQYKALLYVCGILCSIFFCGILSGLAETEFQVASLLILIGTSLGGCNSLMFGPIKVDLGRKLKLASRNMEVGETLSTITGLMEGIAVLAAAIGQLAIPQLKNGDEWLGTVIFLLILLILSAFMLLLPTIRDIREVWTRFKERRSADLDD